MLHWDGWSLPASSSFYIPGIYYFLAPLHVYPPPALPVYWPQVPLFLAKASRSWVIVSLFVHTLQELHRLLLLLLDVWNESHGRSHVPTITSHAWTKIRTTRFSDSFVTIPQNNGCYLSERLWKIWIIPVEEDSKSPDSTIDDIALLGSGDYTIDSGNMGKTGTELGLQVLEGFLDSGRWHWSRFSFCSSYWSWSSCGCVIFRGEDINRSGGSSIAELYLVKQFSTDQPWLPDLDHLRDGYHVLG